MDIFNVVVTGDSFWHLRYFVASLVDQTEVGYRLVANGCDPDAVGQMREFAGRHADRVDVTATSDQIVAHGVALDAVLRAHDDGPRYCFVDPDIKANGPFLADFERELDDADAVTSGRELWNDDNVLPAGAGGVGGRHFFAADGFAFGSPHFAMYRREPLEDTMRRWRVGFGAAGPELDADVREHLDAAGRGYLLYDTAKVLNILFQLDGHRLVHREHDNLIHVGGLSHFLTPAEGEPSGEVQDPHWAVHESVRPRLELARYTAAVLRAAIERDPVPPVPDGLDPAVHRNCALVRTEMSDLVDRYRDW